MTTLIPYAQTWRRAAAVLIDYTVALAIAASFDAVGRFNAGVLLAILYILVKDRILCGKSIGKLFLGIHAVNRSTLEPISGWTSIKRNLPIVILLTHVAIFGYIHSIHPVKTGIGLVINAMILAGLLKIYRGADGKDHATVGDRWADTVVINRWKWSGSPQTVADALGQTPLMDNPTSTKPAFLRSAGQWVLAFGVVGILIGATLGALWVMERRAKETPSNLDEWGKGDPIVSELSGILSYERGISLYSGNKNFPKNYYQALMHFREASELGHTRAQFYLGYMYFNGEGVPKDLVQAHVWFNIAGVKGDEDAKKNLAIVENQMTGSQKEKAMDMARELFAKLPKGN